MNGFVTGVIGSLLVALLYGMLFAQREDKIRGYLSRQRKGLARRWYVSAFVGAARGHAVAGDTGRLGWLVLLVFYVLSLWLSSTASDIEAEIRTLHVDLARSESITAKPPTLDDLRQRFDDLKRESARYTLAMRIGSWLSLGVFCVGLVVWRPFIIMRRRFAHELDRFTMRIQGLASKVELAELATLESRVRDERSLRAFIAAARAIATRHQVSALAETFDLWRDESKP